MTAVETGHGSQAAVADLAAIDCKTGAPSWYSQIYLPHIGACLTVKSRPVLLHLAGLVDTQRAVLCLAL